MSKDFAVGPQGPSLDEPIVINDDGSVEALEAALQEVDTPSPEVEVTLTLTEKEFNAISRVFATTMMQAFPRLFFSDQITEEGMEAFVSLSEHIGISNLLRLNDEDASNLKAKLAQASLEVIKTKGLNVKDILDAQMKLMKGLGFETKVSESVPEGEYYGEVIESTEQARPAEGNTSPEEAQRGSEPEPGQS